MSYELEKSILQEYCSLSSIQEVRKFTAMLNPVLFKNFNFKNIATKAHELVSKNKWPDTTRLMSVFAKSSNEYDTLLNLYDASFVTNAGLEGHIELLKQEYISSQITALMTKTKTELEESTDKFEVIGEFISKCKSIRDNAIDLSVISTRNKIKATVDEYKLIKEGNYNSIVPYCVKSVDDNVFVTRGQVHVLSAQSGHGKTALALSFLKSQIEAGFKVAFFCCESRHQEILNRLACIISGASYLNIFNKFHGNEVLELNYLQSFEWLLKKANNFQLFGLGDYKHSVRGIEEKLIEISKSQQYDMIYIDYLQSLISASNKPRHEQIEIDMQDICKLAGEYEVAITLLSQFNRTVAHDEKPDLHHLKGSSSIENYAHIASFLVCKEKEYNPQALYVDFEFYSKKTRLQSPFKISLQRYKNGEFKEVETRRVY